MPTHQTAQRFASNHLTSQHSATAPHTAHNKTRRRAVQDKQTGHGMRTSVLGNAVVDGFCSWGSPVAIWGNDPRNCWYWSLHCRAKPRCFSSGKVQWSFWDGTCCKRLSFDISMLHAVLLPRRGYRRYPAWGTPWHIPWQLGRPSSLQWCLPAFYQSCTLMHLVDLIEFSQSEPSRCKSGSHLSYIDEWWYGHIWPRNGVLQCFASLQPPAVPVEV